MDKQHPQRTARQNAAMHLAFRLLADELNDRGLEMRRVLKPDVSIYWTPESIKEYLWRPVQEAMFNKKSTKDLNTKQVDQVFDVINRHLGEKFSVHIPFPSIEAIALEQLEKESNGQ